MVEKTEKDIYRLYYKIGDITIQVESEIPISDETFIPRFKAFAVNGPGDDNVVIRHHFSLPDIDESDMGKEVYNNLPWKIYRKDDSWMYLCASNVGNQKQIYQMSVFSHDHKSARIYNRSDQRFQKGGMTSFGLYTNDQILIAQLLAHRNGCYMHSSGVSMDGKGILFIGRSGVGKSTITKMVEDQSRVICDEMIILRRYPHEYRIYGTWNYSEFPDVYPGYVPLKAIFFLEQAKDNYIVEVKDKKEIIKRLLGCLVRPFVTANWWNNTLDLLENISSEVPCFVLHFDKSGQIVDHIKKTLKSL
ncbi:hypothetical protein GF312_02615 [Candidatus Poribacteria bacterium]|nr:hypothetical protein [Candidatus Poribacteria bacterium]